jgi:uncharacterized membrane protein
MTRLIAFVFDDPCKGEKVRIVAHQMVRECLLEIYDRVHISKSQDGKIHIAQEDKSIVKTQEEGLRDGAAVRVGGLRLPFVARRLLCKMRDHCVTLKFISHVSREVAPGNSALILLVRCDHERHPLVMERMKEFEVTILESALPPELDQEIERTYSGDKLL